MAKYWILTAIGDRNVVWIREYLVGNGHQTTITSVSVERQTSTVSSSEQQVKLL